MDARDPLDFDQYYDDFPRIEDEFTAFLDESLQPRGPDLLYELVAGMRLSPGSRALDVGCGEGDHALRLAESFGLAVHGIDPVPRHVELASALIARLPDRLSFAPGRAERLPVEPDSVDLVWCRDVLVHVRDLDAAYGEFRRVLRPHGRVLVYQMFGTGRLEPREADWLFTTMGVVPASADPAGTERAVAAAGLHIDECLELGTEWGEYAEEHSAHPTRKLRHAARLLRAPDRYLARYGRTAYDIMLGDCLWHIYRMIGKLSPRVYLLSR